jgi:DNA-binding CsgD family transcriptional regulator
MTIDQANKKLILARKKRDKINTEIMALHDFLIQKKKNAISILEKRNKEIYNLYLRNKSIKETARCFKLSTDRIRNICLHTEKQHKKEKIIEAWINRNSK